MISPSVTNKLTNNIYYTPHLNNEVACFVGHFERGPINFPIFITSIDQFKFLFGRGIGEYFQDWYQVFNFLQYASGIWVVRSSGSMISNANNNDDIYINTFDDFTSNFDSISVFSPIRIIARTPGIWGNILSVSIITKVEWDDNVYLIKDKKSKDFFDFFEDNYIGICVFRTNTLVEKYYIKINEIQKVNDESLYVYIKLNENTKLSDLPFYGNNILKLTGGYNSFPTDDDFKISHDILQNNELYDIDIIIGNEKVNRLAIDFVENKKDCMAFIGIPSYIVTYLKMLVSTTNTYETVYTSDGRVIVTDSYKLPNKLTKDAKLIINEYINSLPKSTRTHFTMNAKNQFDVFSDTYKMVNVAGDIAGLKAQSSLISPWTASAGLERGQIKNVQKMYILISDKDHDEYYKLGINFIKNKILMTQKTFYDKPTPFNRVNISSLFNHIRKNTKKILNKFIFAESTINIRQNIATQIKKYLEDVKLNRGISDAKIHIRLNENNQTVIDIFVKPTHIIEFINIRIKNVGTNLISEIIS